MLWFFHLKTSTAWEESMPGLKKRRPPRGMETKERIWNAGLELFSQKGLHGTNSREIAAAAGVSIGSFYTYYKNKHILFIDLIRAHCREVLEVLESFSVEAHMNRDSREVIHNLISIIWNLHDSVYPLNQKAIALREIDPEIDRIIGEQEAAIAQRLVSILERAETRLRIEDKETAAWLMQRIIMEVMHSVSRMKPQKESNRIVNELVDMIARYLIK